MKTHKILSHSNAILWGIISIALLLWLTASWFITGYILDSRVKALIEEKTAAINQQAVNITDGIALNLNHLDGIQTVVARDAGVLRALSRFGIDTRPSQLVFEQRKKIWSEDVHLKTVGSYLNLVGSSMGEDAVFIMNAAGDCVAASNMDKPGSFVGTNFAAREYFRDAMAGKKGYQYAMGKITNIPGLFFSEPIIFEGRIVGVVTTKVNLHSLSHLVNQADSFITDKYGVVILAHDPKFEMRSLPGASIAGLSKEARIDRYKREDFPVLSVNSWSGQWGALLHRFDEESQPLVLTDKTMDEQGRKVYVYRHLPEITEMTQDRLKLFLLLGISGAVALLIIGARIIFLRIREQAEELLNKLSVAVEQSPTSVTITDLKANIQYINPRFSEVSGYTPEEVIGKNPRIFKSGQMSNEFYQEMWGRLTSGLAWHGDILNRRKNGEIYWEETHIAPVKNPSGIVTHYVAVKSDITERKRQDSQILESEQRLLKILNMSPIAILITAKQGSQIVFYNPRYADMLKNPDAMGEDPKRYYARAADYEEILDEVTHGNDVFNRQIKLNIPDGSTVWALASYMPLKYHGEDAVLGWFYDISQLKQTEEAMHQARHKAEAASLAKSEFLANMSHEIRTPMNAILGMAEILSESELTAEQRKYVAIFQNAGSNLLELINDILDMSKVEAGQMELDKSDFSLEQALNDLIDLHAIRAFDKGLELVLDIEPGVPEFAFGDAKRLKQCLTNLVGNAIKFSHEGVIVISVRPVNSCADMWQFSVSDSGIGISAEKHETIFEAFSQADSSTTRRFGGTGLGLTITRRLVGLMDGKIWVESQEEKGSTFFFTAHLPQAAKAVRTDLPINLHNLKVLVVDDHAINRTIVRQYLQPLGAQVFEASSAIQALVLIEEAAVKNAPFDLALFDCQMPEVDGIDLSVHIRADPTMEGLKIMILSSSDTAQQRQRANGLELTFLLKPIKRHELIQSIGHELQQHAPALQKAKEPSSVLHPPRDGLRILLAEDNQDNVLLIEVYLKPSSHYLDVAENGLVAVEKFRSNRYDVILMDVQMPKMGGYEATAEIRYIEQMEGRAPTMIIALTAHALKEDEQRSIDAGCNGHLTKPLKKKVLYEMLQSIQQPKQTN